MRQYRTRVRKMRQPGQHHGRSTDGIRETYHDPDIRAARRARDRELDLADQDQSEIHDQEQGS